MKSDNSFSASLVFSRQSAPDGDSIRLGEAVAQSTHLKKLHLDVSGMTAAGTRTLVPAISTAPSLGILRLEGDISTQNSKRLTATITNKFVKAAQKNASVHTLHLSRTHFGSPCVSDCLENLKELVLCDVWHDAKSQMIERLADSLSASSLETFTMGSLGDHLSVPFLEALQSHPSLQCLHIGCNLSAETAKALRCLLDTTEKLRRVQIFGSSLNVQNWEPVIQGLISNRTVEELVVASCKLQDCAVPWFGKLFRSGNRDLVSVNFTESIDTVDQLAAIMAPLHRNTSIRKIDVCRCGFGINGGIVLDDLLRRNRHLHQLDIDRNPNIRISRGLAHNRSLRSLDVSMTHLTNVGLASLADAIARQGGTITHLFACGNEFSNIKPLADILDNSGITHLFIHGNSFGNDGAMQIAKATKLRVLHMDHCHIGAKGAAAALANIHFRTLSIRGLDLREETALDMENALAGMSTELEHLNVGVEFTPPSEGDDDDSDDESEDPRNAIRAVKMRSVLLNRGLNLRSICISEWFQLDKQAVSFTLERNAARRLSNAATFPHAIAKLQLSTAYWLLRRDPSTWVAARKSCIQASPSPKRPARDAPQTRPTTPPGGREETERRTSKRRQTRPTTPPVCREEIERRASKRRCTLKK